MFEKISKADADLLLNAVNKIICSEVLEKNITDKLPLTDDLSDANKIYSGKISVLFVDIRKSTKLPEQFSTEQLVKIYRSYIRTVVQAIRYAGGVVKSFMGDGVLAVFIDDEIGSSEDKSVYAARYITTAIDKMLNPKLYENMKYRISCGIGIHTGEISISKVGMKGREQDDEMENEFGIAWIGNSTNLACKFSGAVDCGTIFISTSTYIALSDMEEKQNWAEVSIYNGKNNLHGYIAKQYYLKLDEEIEACPAMDNKENQSLKEEIKKEYLDQINEIEKKSHNLGKLESELEAKEKTLKLKSEEVLRKEKGNQLLELELLKREYLFLCNVLGSGHCKSEYVKIMGKDFWEENLNKAIVAGEKIGKSEHLVKQEISYAMVSIYEDLHEWDKAYDFLVEQATGCEWLHLFTVQKIVSNVGYCERLKDAVYSRIYKHNLSSNYQQEFEKIKDWLVFEYRK